MNIIRSIAFTVIALSSTVALAHDGSERASPAAEKIKIAQELKFNDQLNSEASRLVNTEKQTPANEPEKG
ncbi:hypothetical protein AUC61_17010 [Pseudomonas sp. S25]|uniref:Secreted protein n=1 Tax=Pseudomonas maioricensis TaxID=1766623 RepID=A0ABS9ZKX8_9PSED|nr:hypothetical protein [Pseudomonas sp. S25]MCI8211229.1 hypothetical protein [Pseudomonas sp. S25]